MTERIAFIGGGNMARAIIGGLIKQCLSTQSIDVVEPLEEGRDKIQRSFGITTQAHAGTVLSDAALLS